MTAHNHRRNVVGLVAHAQARKAAAYRRVQEAIMSLLHGPDLGPVNFNSVAKRAQVSKSYLYDQEDLRSQIETVRDQQLRNSSSPKRRQSAKTDAGKDVVIFAKERRIRALEEEVRHLRKDLQVALGKLYDRT